MPANLLTLKMKGFTLIELLIVIAIILILISIALPNFLEAQIRARVVNAKGCLQALRTAQEGYFNDFNRYIPDVDGGGKIMVGGIYRRVRDLPGYNCNATGAKEICSYRMLSTPIAYMKELCSDPFVKDNLDKAILQLFEYTYYDNSAMHPNDKRNRKVRFAFETGLRYIMFSTGPDGNFDVGSYTNAFDYLGHHTHHIWKAPVIYSPTNGTKSSGDIITSNRGHEGA